MKKLGVLITLTVSGLPAVAQTTAEAWVNKSVSATAPSTVYTAPPPVTVDGQRADEMSDEQLLDFFNQKARTVQPRPDGTVIIRVTAGYPVTVDFDQPVSDLEIGDAGMLKIRRSGNRLIIRSKRTEGTTKVDVFYANRQKTTLQVFITPTFKDADSIVNIVTATNVVTNSGAVRHNLHRYLPDLLRVIKNYDLLLKERAIQPADCQRVTPNQTVVEKNFQQTGFWHYETYIFKNGFVVMTFGWRNSHPLPVRLDESRFRVAIGQSQYIPEHVELDRTVVPVNGSVGGWLLFYHPAFDLRQPLKFIWK